MESSSTWQRSCLTPAWLERLGNCHSGDPMATSDQLAEWDIAASDVARARALSPLPACGLQEYANPAPTASAVIRDEAGRILLARRANDPGAGLWDLLGGFMNEGEEPLEALRRELREETGLEVEPGDYLGGLPERYGEDGIWTVNFYWAGPLGPGEPQPADDVAELAWFPAGALPPRDQFAFPNTVELLERAGASFT